MARSFMVNIGEDSIVPINEVQTASPEVFETGDRGEALVFHYPSGWTADAVCEHAEPLLRPLLGTKGAARMTAEIRSIVS